jgi:hypothetical protein
MRRALVLLAAAALLGLTGCPPEKLPDTITLYGVTVAPPARTAALVSDDIEHTVQMSQGVVFAVSCWDTCTGSCEGPVFTVSDPAVAEVRPVFRSSGGYPAWVVVAKTAGTAQIRVTNACAEQAYNLTVTDDQP